MTDSTQSYQKAHNTIYTEQQTELRRIVTMRESTASNVASTPNTSEIEDTGSLYFFWITEFHGRDGSLMLFGKVMHWIIGRSHFHFLTF